MRKALVLLFLLSCGDAPDAPEPWTWGDSVQEISEGWCYAEYQCDQVNTYQGCVDHLVDKFCAKGNCDVVLEESEEPCVYDDVNQVDPCNPEEAALNCREAFEKYVEYDPDSPYAQLQCLSLAWGNYPLACWDALSFRPPKDG